MEGYTQNEISESLVRVKGKELDLELARFVRNTLSCGFSEKETLEYIRHKVETNRKLLDKFERELPWEDEE